MFDVLTSSRENGPFFLSTFIKPPKTAGRRLSMYSTSELDLDKHFPTFARGLKDGQNSRADWHDKKVKLLFDMDGVKARQWCSEMLIFYYTWHLNIYFMATRSHKPANWGSTFDLDKNKLLKDRCHFKPDSFLISFWWHFCSMIGQEEKRNLCIADEWVMHSRRYGRLRDPFEIVALRELAEKA